MELFFLFFSVIDTAISGGSYNGSVPIVRGNPAFYPFTASLLHVSGAYPIARLTSAVSRNYQVYYLTSNISISNGTEALLSPKLLPGSLDLIDSQIGLEIGETKTIMIRTSIGLDKEQCEAMVYICLLLLDHEHASYEEGNIEDNVFCVDVSAVKVCSPGMIVKPRQGFIAITLCVRPCVCVCVSVCLSVC